MMAVKVWAPVFTSVIYNGGGPAVIDDLPTAAECKRVSAELVRANLSEQFPPQRMACIERWKLVPKTGGATMTRMTPKQRNLAALANAAGRFLVRPFTDGHQHWCDMVEAGWAEQVLVKSDSDQIEFRLTEAGVAEFNEGRKAA